MITRHATVYLFALLLAGAAEAGLSADQKCHQAKLRAQGKLELCLKKGSAKEISGGTDALADCWAKFESTLAKADAKAAKSGALCRFMDNADGTVSDLDTGLMWQRKSNADGVANLADPHDGDNVYTWSAAGAAPDGTAFTVFLRALNNGSSPDGDGDTAVGGCFAGLCDWRLPTVVELQRLADLTQCGPRPCIDPDFGPLPISGFYWSSTAQASDPTRAYDAKFNPASAGEVFTWSKVNTNLVLATRGGFSRGAPLQPAPTATPTTPVPTPTPECMDPSDCPATGDECTIATCNGNVCGTLYADFGHPVSTGQTAGDCEVLVCNGAGGMGLIDDLADVPIPSTVCLSVICAGSPAGPVFTAVLPGSDCTADNIPPAHVCGSGPMEGTCVECNSNGDCQIGETCTFGACQ